MSTNHGKYSFFLTLALLITIVWSSCNNNSVIYEQHSPIGEWPQDQSVEFNDLVLSDSCQLFLTIGHSEDYGFENVYVQLTWLNEGAESDSVQVISIPLLNGQSQWRGQKEGNMRSVKHLISTVTSTGAQPEGLKVAQYSRLEVLDGIEEITISIEDKSGKK